MSFEEPFSSKRSYLTTTIYIVLFFIAYFLCSSQWFFSNTYGTIEKSIGDDGLLEINVINATKGQQLLGPYSRYGFNHPGPFFYYLSVPLYLIFGINGLWLTAYLLNIVSLLIMLWCAYKLGGNAFFSIVSVVLIFYICFFDLLATNTWNPYFTILPLGAFFFLSNYFASGKTKILPYVIIFFSLTTQSHIAYIPLCSVILVTSIIFYFKNKNTQNWKFIFYLSAAIGLLIWLPSIWEAISSRGGNVMKLLKYIITGNAIDDKVVIKERSFIYKIKALFYMISRFLSLDIHPSIKKTVKFHSDIFSYITGFAFIFVTFSLYYWRNKFNRFQKVFAVLTIISIAIALFSIVSIKGHIYSYLILWMSILGVFLIISASTIFYEISLKNKVPFQKLIFKTIPFAIVILVILWKGAIVYELQYYIPKEKYENQKQTIACNKIKDIFEADSSPLLLTIGKQSIWEHVVPYAAWLYRNGYDFTIEDRWLYMYGHNFKKRGNESKAIIFTDEPALENIYENYIFNSRVNKMFIYIVDIQHLNQIKEENIVKDVDEMVFQVQLLKDGNSASILNPGDDIILEISSQKIIEKDDERKTTFTKKDRLDIYLCLAAPDGITRYLSNNSFIEKATPIIEAWKPKYFDWYKYANYKLKDDETICGEYDLMIYLVPSEESIDNYSPTFSKKITVK